MSKIADPWGHHDWDSRKYVSEWAKGQDQREVDRQGIFALMAKTLPYDRAAPIDILDLGAGYGALAQFLLKHFPNATAVCQDGSEEMAKLGRKRMKDLKGRVKYVLCDFSKRGWSRKIKGPFDAVVSSIAIHNVRSPEIIRSIYGETFSLVKPGGCFLNFDRMTPSLKEQLQWLGEAGFENVKSLRDGGRRALLGGFRK
ncbi:MAG TPA: class I SAM-dependent methyltransferase [Candidatus Binatia bacterium]